MKSITQNKRYLPHEISTKVQSVILYRMKVESAKKEPRYSWHYDTPKEPRDQMAGGLSLSPAMLAQ